MIFRLQKIKKAIKRGFINYIAYKEPQINKKMANIISLKKDFERDIRGVIKLPAIKKFLKSRQLYKEQIKNN